MKSLLVVLIPIFWFQIGSAFPDTNRHGYMNCTTCHPPVAEFSPPMEEVYQVN